MALERHNRIVETTTTTGTGTYDLAGAKTGFEAFVDRVTSGATVEYCVTDGTDFEIGIGTFTDASPDTLARTTILASTNGDAAVNWGAGSKDIFISLPASSMVPGDANEAAYFSADGVLDGFSPIALSTTTQNMLLTTSGTGVIGQIIKATAGQTANLFEIRDSADDELFIVKANGQTGIGIVPTGNHRLDVQATGSAVYAGFGDLISTGPLFYLGSDGSTAFLKSRNNHPLTFYANDIEWVRIDPDGKVGFNTTSFTAQIEVHTSGTGVIGQIIKATAGQTANLQEWQDSSGAILAVIEDDGATGIANGTEGGTARLTTRTSHETHTLTLGTTSDTTTISIPSGARLLAVSMTVNTAVTDDAGDDTWSAAFVTGSTTTIETGVAAAQNTKVNFMVPDEITTDVTQIQFTPQGGSFSAGVIEIVAYYEELTSLANV